MGTSIIEGVVTSRSRGIMIMWNRCILCQEKESPIVEKGISALGSFERASETADNADECGPLDVKLWGSFILTQLYNLTEEEFREMWGDGAVEGRIRLLEICSPCVQLVREFRSCHEEMQGIQRKMESMRQVARGNVLGSPLETDNVTGSALSSAAPEDQIREYFRNVVDHLGQPPATTSHHYQEIYIKEEPPFAEDMEMDLGLGLATSQTHAGEGESVSIADIGAEETEPCQAAEMELRKSKIVKASSTSKAGSNSESMEGAFRGTTLNHVGEEPDDTDNNLLWLDNADKNGKDNNLKRSSSSEMPDTIRNVVRGGSTSVMRRQGRGRSAATKVHHACTVCGKSFTRKQNFNRHVRVHSGEKPFLCVMCNKKFARYSALEEHMRTHTQERPLACSKCDKAFSHSRTLKNHILTHAKTKFHVCIFCGKGFFRQAYLMSHIRMHTREKVYLCKLCKQEFFHAGGLSRHIRIHKNERAWACEFCSKKFVQYYGLDSHMRVHTQEKPFFCKTCGQEFSHLYSLKWHAKRRNHLY